MNTRGVIGKRIVAVKQERFRDETAGTRMDVQWIELEDGTRLVLHVYETEDCPIVDASVIRPEKRGKRDV